MVIIMNNTQSTFISNGYTLAKQFDAYLNLLESELCHEMLPAQLQAVAIRGLRTTTGLDIAGWHRFHQSIVLVLDSKKNGLSEPVNDYICEWLECIQKLSKFLKIIPNESSRFYDKKEIENDVKTLCEQGATLITEMIEWMQNAHTIN
ncbi:hypothetical protein PV797_10505 [Clostridiaceae bacterium M8S5]|nr:hypothetical protein PV797_10505 [Clostridiaceae bacterium M8S5]